MHNSNASCERGGQSPAYRSVHCGSYRVLPAAPNVC